MHKKTHGQGNITFEEFSKEVNYQYKRAIGSLPKADIKKMYNKGLTIEDAVSQLIMKTK